MKRLIYSLAFITASIASSCAYAQTPTVHTPPVGIGISSPISDLHIHSTEMHEYPGGYEPLNRDGVYPGYFVTTFLMTNTYSGSTANDGFFVQLKDKELTMKLRESGKLNIFAKNGKGITIDSAGRIGIRTEPVYNRNLIVSGSVGITGPAFFSDSAAFSDNISVAHKLYTNNLIATGTVSIAGNTSIGNGFYCSYNGHLKTKEIVVTLDGWSDYVFDSGYRLMPLGELESYINANKHLPNIPSASEVESNGVNVGEMNALLLEKIEELTLYIIDLQKQIDELKESK